jgi:hypothetical protein
VQLVCAVPGVDLALVGEWEQVKAEMMVRRNKRVEPRLNFLKIADLHALVDVESRDSLDRHLKNDADGADAPMTALNGYSHLSVVTQRVNGFTPRVGRRW